MKLCLLGKFCEFLKNLFSLVGLNLLNDYVGSESYQGIISIVEDKLLNLKDL